MNSIDTDIVIIGCGAAGLRAAVEASMLGVTVTVINKGKQNSCTYWADRTFEIVGGGGCGFAAPIISPDSPERYFEDLNRIACGRNLSELTFILAEKSASALNYLRYKGVNFKKNQNNSLLAIPEIWHTFPRIFYSKKGTGRQILQVLRKEAKSLGVKIIDNTQAFKLLVNSGEITGCLAFSNRTKDFIFFQCKAAILATGGAGRAFRYSSNPPGIAGDGISLASEIGAKLINMDLYSDIPMTVRPQYGYGFVPYLIFSGTDKKLDELLESQIIYWKWNTEKLPLGEFRLKFPKTLKSLKKSGIELNKDSLEFHWMAHFMLGGVRINAKSETSVKGLYAAGEVAGGVTGMNRLPGTGISEGIVFGKIAGQNAANYVKRRSLPIIDKKIIKNELKETRIISKAIIQELEYLKDKITYLTYRALLDKKGIILKSLEIDLMEVEKEINTKFGCEYKKFIPSLFQARKIFELKNILTFSRLFINERKEDFRNKPLCHF